MRTHRVGTITLGLILIVFGTLFLVHMVVPTFGYKVIYKLWPIMLITLGMEILLTNKKVEQDKFIYDKGAIFLMILICFFSMTMATFEVLFWI